MRGAVLSAAFCLGALAAVLLSGPARAGDAAEAEVLGFSADGRLFAFEEYGVQDGSGFPYAHVFVIDVDSDRWVAGTPIRVRLEEEDATLAEARAEAASRLRDSVGERFDSSGAVTLAHAPLGEVEADPTRLAFAPVIPSNPLEDPALRFQARLELFHAEAQAKSCVDYIGDRPMGFRLIIEREGGEAVVLHEDHGIPFSRGCPITYRLSRVVVPGYSPERVAVLVSVFTPGFEGADRRFIAVTGRLPE